MVRIFSTVFLFLLSASVCAWEQRSGKPFTERTKDVYLVSFVNFIEIWQTDVALAIASDKAYGAAMVMGQNVAILKALQNCRRASTRPDTCEIVDVNGESELMSDLVKGEQRGVASTTVGERNLVGTGTGFVINSEYVVTADHVLTQCNAVSIRHQHKELEGDIAARDTNNDLGLIRLAEKFESSAKLRNGKPTTLGEMVANYGYPLFGQLSDAAKVTQGNINALAGWQNDSSILQFDAPTQPGNSGGPLLDASANVVGVVSSGLSKEYAIQTDHIAQNVNFAVKSYLVEGFLTANGVTYEKAESPETLSLPKIAEKAETFTVLVGCWQ